MLKKAYLEITNVCNLSCSCKNNLCSNSLNVDINRICLCV